MAGWYDDTQSLSPTGRKAQIAPGRIDHRMRITILAILGCLLWLAILSKIEEANLAASREAAWPSPPPGCQVYANPEDGKFDITLIIFGPKQEEAVVELYRPWRSGPFPVLERYPKSFPSNGSPYIHQTIDRTIVDGNLWMPGKWIVKWQFGSWAGSQRLNLTDADWTIAVRCYISRFR